MKSIRDHQRPRAFFNSLAIGVVLAVGAAAYSSCFSGLFVLDDLDEITDNEHIRIKKLDANSFWNAAWLSPSPRRPVANVTLALNYFAGGYDVWGYHAVNLVIHLACAVLVYFFADFTFRISDNERISPSLVALIASLIFVSHPVQTQAVTYIVQRMTSIAAMFYLAAMLLYIRGRVAVRRQRALCWAGGVICGLMALGTKEIAVTLPFAILLYEWYFFRRLDVRWARRTVAWILPLAVVAGSIALMSSAIRLELFGGYAIRDFTLAQRLLTECRVLVYYVSLVLWPLPSRLSITHDIIPSQSLLDPITTVLSLATLLGLGALAVATANRYVIVSFGIAWFFLHLVVESTVLPLELAFEHRLYLPMVGLSLVAAWVLCAAVREVRWIILASAALVLLLTAATYQRNRVWQDDYLLWSDALAKYPNDARAHNNLGIALDAQQQHSAAEEEYRRAVQLRPDYAHALVNLGGSLTAAGKPAEALPLLRRAIDLDPSHADAHYNLGIALSKLNEPDEAIASFRRALELRPGFVEAHNNLGYGLDTQGKFDEAIEHYRQALKLGPENAEVLNNLGVTLAKQGKLAEAVETLERSIEVQPDDADTHYNLGNLLGIQGRRLDSQIQLRRALELAVAKGDKALAEAIRHRLSQ